MVAADPAQSLAPERTLNPGQHRAATAGMGAHLVLAGPGTGKTTTLVARFAHLVQGGLDPSQILAVTFTRKAAEALRSRIGQTLGRMPDSNSVGTFHSLAGRMLRDLAPAAGVSPGFSIADNRASRAVLHEHRIFWDEDEDLLDIIAGAKERLLSPKAFKTASKTWIANGERPSYYEAAARFYGTYQSALENRNMVDFGDLVMKLIEAMDEDPERAASLINRFTHVLVDEYQDVNPAQIALIERLIAPHGNLWAVGDDDQCLYAFRAATPEFILSFEDRHPGAAIHTLSENYRSTPEILKAAESLIAANAARRPKVLTAAAQSKGREVRFADHRDSQSEAEAIADWFRRLVAAGARPSEMAVLCRVSALTIPLQGALRRVGLPFVVRGSGDLWNATETRAFAGVLLMAEIGEHPRAFDLLGLSPGRAGSKRAEALRKKAPALTDLPFPERLDKAAEAVSSLMPKWKGAEYQLAWAENVDAARSLAEGCRSAEELLQMIEEQKRALREAETGDAIVLSTVHAAKGLEWPRVAVIGLEDGILPHQAALDSGDLEEERRIFYVAVTRARSVLVLSRAAERGGRHGLVPSRFLMEAGHPPLPRLPAAPPSSPHKPAKAKGKKTAGADKRAGSVWTAEEEEALEDAFAAGEDIGTIALRMGRGRGAVWMRLTKLGLVKPRKDKLS